MKESRPCNPLWTFGVYNRKQKSPNEKKIQGGVHRSPLAINRSDGKQMSTGGDKKRLKGLSQKPKGEAGNEGIFLILKAGMTQKVKKTKSRGLRSKRRLKA